MICDFPASNITTVQCCDRVNAHDTHLPFWLCDEAAVSFVTAPLSPTKPQLRRKAKTANGYHVHSHGDVGPYPSRSSRHYEVPRANQNLSLVARDNQRRQAHSGCM